MKTNFDYIIVGAGSAGCVLANRLSANPNNEVCLIEAGPKDDSWQIHLPLGVVLLMRNKKLNWQFNSYNEPHLNQRTIFNPRGKTLGGSSSINAMLYTRGQPEDYDEWQALGNKGWGWKDVLPYFKSTQFQERGESEYHGTSGELNVADSRSNHPRCLDFIEAAVKAGFKANNDFNGPSQEGVGMFQVTQKNGQRFSTAKAFLDPVRARKNLTVLTECLVEKVIMSEKTATGVRLRQNRTPIELHATKEVLLSAGAYNSPQLLMLSGIGPKEELTKHNIECIHALPGVGKNLQDHVDALVVNHFDDSSLLALRPKSLIHHTKGLWHYWQQKRGILTSPVAESGGFIKSSPDLERPDLQLHFIPGAMDDHGRNNKMLTNYGVSMHVCLLRPESRGEVTLNSNSPTDKAVITTNMLSEKRDMETMVKGINICREIMRHEPLKFALGKEIFPGLSQQSDDQIECFLRQKANTIYHPVGTCKMGDDEMSVVDSNLRVHGVTNLRVVDASIMPTLISGNTNAPTVMIAAKTADKILGYTDE